VLCSNINLVLIAQHKMLMDFETDENSGKLHCKECFQVNPAKTAWITRAAAKQHLEDSSEHAANVQTNLERHSTDTACRQHLSAVYSFLSYSDFDSTVPNPLPSVRPALFDTNNNHIPAMMHNRDGNDLFGPMDDLVISTGVTPLVDDPSIENECLR
jgi:hypothetical protein